MSSTYAEPIARLQACLDEIAAVDPVYRTTSEKQDLLVGLATVITRAQAEHQRVLAVADDVAEATGARSAAAWLADTTREAHGRVRADARLAEALDRRFRVLAEAFAAGRANLAQVRVIHEALEALPTELGEDLLVKAETHLVDQATDHGPRDLKVLGARILSVVAPEIADQTEYDALLAAERRASAATRLTHRRRGDGSADIHARVPELALDMLLTYLNAFTNPRRRHQPDQQSHGQAEGADEFAHLPIARQRGLAFVALLERVLTTDVPRHGGRATSLVVTIDHHTLADQVEQAGIAQTTTGLNITAGQARRMACQAGILPMVLGGNSVVLDQGRKKRCYDDNQRLALEVRDKRCTETHCSVPAAFTEAHHMISWSHGGLTDLNDGRLLCYFHHDRAHDPRWTTTYHPDGTTTFHRRQ